MANRIFISYRRDDTRDLSGRLADRLFLRRYVERLLRQRATAVRAACEAL